ncbi:sphingolipid transporter [Aureococcus anophagefferens]|nr:sphingolipid transporter [Aureococcus anophagefferens]
MRRPLTRTVDVARRAQPNADADASAPMSDGRRTALLASLVAVYTSNQWCRSLLFSTVDFGSDDGVRFVNAALGLSRSDYAILGTLAFNVLFGGCSLAAGAVVDRADAAKLTWLSCGVWSLATVASGSCESFARASAAAQGVAMAATAPAGYALIGRAFPPDKLATATSRYAAAVVGAAGWPSPPRRRSRCPASASARARRPGARRRAAAASGPARVAGRRSCCSRRRPRFCAGFTIAVWALPCLRSAFPARAADLGLGYAFVVGGAGFASALLGGAAADALAARAPPGREKAARALVPVVGSLLAAPLWVAALLRAPTFEWAVGLLALEFLAAECWIGPTTALIQAEVAPRSRGLAQGTFTSLTLLGSLAPLAAGKALDADATLDAGVLVSAVVAGAYVVSALLFLGAAAALDTEPKTALGAGFGTDVRKAKKGGKKSRSSAAGLTTDNGWVPLDGDVVATSCECGRCEYPLTKSETQVVDGVEQVLCEMCGAAYSLDDGAGVASEAKGNPLFGALLRNKPDKPLSVYPTKELDGGAVYVNITPKSRKAAAIDAM